MEESSSAQRRSAQCGAVQHKAIHYREKSSRRSSRRKSRGSMQIRKLPSLNAKRTVVAAFVDFEAALEEQRKDVNDGRLLPAI